MGCIRHKGRPGTWPAAAALVALASVAPLAGADLAALDGPTCVTLGLQADARPCARWVHEEEGLGPYGRVTSAAGRVFGVGIDFSTSPRGSTAFALDAATGAELWSAPGHLGAAGAGIAADGARLYVGGASSGGSTVRAYDAATGDVRWTSHVPGSNVVVPAAGDRVYAVRSAAPPGAAGLRATDGAVLWMRLDVAPTGGWITAAAVSPGGARLFLAGSADDAFFATALDAATGATLWTAVHRPGGIGGHANALAVSPDGATVVAAGGGLVPDPFLALLGTGAYGREAAVVAFDAATGAVRWSVVETADELLEMDGIPSHEFFRVDVATGVVVTRDAQVVALDHGTADGYRLLSYDLATGGRNWLASPLPSHSPVGHAASVAGPVVSPDGSRVYAVAGAITPVAGATNALVTSAFDAADGALAWSAAYDRAQSATALVDADARTLHPSGMDYEARYVGTDAAGRVVVGVDQATTKQSQRSLTTLAYEP